MVIDTEQTAAARNVPLPHQVIWQQDPPEALGYCCDIRLAEDEAGGYVAHVAQLRGVVSEGDDVESAIKNVLEALRAAIETYQAERMPIPWSEAEPAQPGERSFRVAVNV